jgi:hypothetical protein
VKKLEMVKPRGESSRLKSSHRTLLDSADPSLAGQALSARVPKQAPSLPIIRINPKLSASQLRLQLDHSSKDKNSSSTHLYQQAKNVVAERPNRNLLSKQLQKDIKITYVNSQENSVLDARPLQKLLTKSRSVFGGDEQNDTYLGQVTLGNSHENSNEAYAEKFMRILHPGTLE